MRKKSFIIVGLATAVLLANTVLILHLENNNQADQSPYVAQLSSPIRGLSAQEVDDLLDGRGAGYARTAELNNYPGPRHVLDLKQELSLSPNQETQIQTAFERMQTEAKQIGQEIVQRETQFSDAFANRTISEAELQAQTRELASLYGQLRAIHLQAHLQLRRCFRQNRLLRTTRCGATPARRISRPRTGINIRAIDLPAQLTGKAIIL